MLFETSHWSFPGLILLLSSKGQGQPAWCLFIWWFLIVVVTWVGRMYLPTWTDRGSTKPEFLLSSPLASWIWYIHRNDDVFVDGFEAFNAYGTFMPFLQKDVTPLNRSIVGRVWTCQNCVLPLEWKNQILAFLTMAKAYLHLRGEETPELWLHHLDPSSHEACISSRS